MYPFLFTHDRQNGFRLGGTRFLLLCLCFLLWPTGIVQAQAVATTVTSASDSGPGSLREAILLTNGAAGPNEILFDLPAGVQTIQLQSALPAITSPVTINALGSQSCSTMPPQPQVELDGSANPDFASGLKIEADGTRIIGFYINRWRFHGIDVAASDVEIACNIIGLDQQGNEAKNGTYGINAKGSNIIIGRASGFAGNVISGHQVGIFVEGESQAKSINNVVRGNYLGTKPNGMAAQGNEKGIFIWQHTENSTIGGTTSADANVISGNTSGGLFLSTGATGHRVIGNLIGLAADGATALPNQGPGVEIESVNGNTIGGTAANEANRIAFNTGNGIIVISTSQGNRLLGNSIFSNQKLGIDLGVGFSTDGITPNDVEDGDSGPNGLQNHPTLFEAKSNTSNGTTEINGELNGAPNQDIRVEFFSSESCDPSGSGEGKTFIGATTFNNGPSGTGVIIFTAQQAVPAGHHVTATATDNGGNAPGNTSEFSPCQEVIATQVTQPATLVVQRDSATLGDDNTVLVDVLANDSISDNQPMEIISILDHGGDGTAEIVGNKVLYTYGGTRSRFTQDDGFNYTVKGVNEPSASARTSFAVIQIPPRPDGPTRIELSPNTISEDARFGSNIGVLTAFDADGNAIPNGGFFPRFFFTNLTDEDLEFNKEIFKQFTIDRQTLRLRDEVNFEKKSSYILRITVIDDGVFTQDIVVNVENADDPPTDIRISSNRVDENQPPGAVVGTFSSVDTDSSSHTYELVGFPRVGRVEPVPDNTLFQIDGNTLKTAALLDFEERTSYEIYVRSTGDGGASFERFMNVNLNNLPSPPDAPINDFSLCTGDPITLIERTSSKSSERVLVKIDDITISDFAFDGCTVDGTMTVTSNGDTARSIDFRGEVNERNQFEESDIEDFEIDVAGVTILANAVEIEYRREKARLHLTKPEIKMPKGFGGLSAKISLPTIISENGLVIAGGKMKLPTIKTPSGFELSLSGAISAVDDGYEIDADGSLSLPNIKKNAKNKNGQTCTIEAGVTIKLDALGRSVMVIAAGKDYTGAEEVAPTGDQATVAPLAQPESIEGISLSKVRAGASCDPGLAIGSTGLFLTGLKGEVTVEPGKEQLDVEVTIEAGKSLPVLGPIASVEGKMELRPKPFKLSMEGTLNVLIFEMAKADTTIRKNGFKASIKTNRFFGPIPFNTNVQIETFTKNGKFTFAGSGRVAVELKKGSFGEKCSPKDGLFGFGLVPEVCLAIPPLSLPTLASARVEAGEFNNTLFRFPLPDSSTFGFKGVASILGFSQGFFVSEQGRLTFQNVDIFKLVEAPDLRAIRAAMQQAAASGQVVQAASMNGVTFVENTDVGTDSILIDTPLFKPTIDLTQVQAAGVTDVISQVNLIRHGDVQFTLLATDPVSLTLIAPNGQEVTPDNYAQRDTFGYNIGYSYYADYAEVRAKQQATEDEDVTEGFITPLEESDGDNLPRFRFMPLSYDPIFDNVDLRLDGQTIYFGLGPEDAVWLTPLALAPGEHTVELLRHNTTDVVLNRTVEFITATTYSLISVGGPQPRLGLITDDTSEPETMGKAKVRFVNGVGQNITVLVNGAPLANNLAYSTLTNPMLVDAGSTTLEVRFSADNGPASEALTVDLADGGVYTFFSTDDIDNLSPGFDTLLVQRRDALYAPVYLTTYSIDQAQMNDLWQAKLTGDTDNANFTLSVEGADSPPILGSVAIDASNPAAAQVSWQLTSNHNPTLIQIYANSDEISSSFAITTADGITNTEELPVYEGTLLAEFEITDVSELGGQLVTKAIDLSGLESGSYHIWVRANDGINPPSSSYASAPSVVAAGIQSIYGVNAVRLSQEGYMAMQEVVNASPITIDRSSDFPTDWTVLITPTFQTESNALDIEWAISGHPDVDSYRLLYGHTPLSPTQVITAGGALLLLGDDGELVETAIGSQTIENIAPDLPYYLSIEAVDSESGRVVRSQEVEFIVASTPFTLSSDQRVAAVDPGGKVTIPVTLNADGELFFPNVWLSSNLGGTPPGVTAQFVDDVDGVSDINSGSPTEMLEVSVDASVPPGRYPIVVTGYNGDQDQSLTLQLEVGDVSNTPNTAPTANETLVDVPGATKPVVLGGSDADGDSLTFIIVTQPANGILSGTAPNLTYTPNAGFSGTDSFTYKVNDGAVDSAPATVTIRVDAQSTPGTTNDIFLPFVSQ